jgi:CRP-like cAMP-binding protein
MKSGFDLGEHAFAKVLERRTFAAGDTIFEEGQNARQAFVILRGEVEIVSTNRHKQKIILTTLKTGQLFGELALLKDSRRTATAIARTGCEVMVLSQDVLKRKLDSADPLVQFWISYLADRVIELSKRVGP